MLLLMLAVVEVKLEQEQEQEKEVRTEVSGIFTGCYGVKAFASRMVIIGYSQSIQLMSTHLDPVIQEKLTAFARRRRSLIVTRGIFAAVAMLLLTMLVIAAIDLTVRMPDWLRWTLSGSAYLAVVVIAWRQCLTWLLHAPDSRQLARLIEHAEPRLREDLLSAVELGQTKGEVFDSEQFRALLQDDVAGKMERM